MWLPGDTIRGAAQCVGTLLAFDRGMMAARHQSLRDADLWRRRSAYYGHRALVVTIGMLAARRAMALGGVEDWRLLLTAAICALGFLLEAVFGAAQGGAAPARSALVLSFLFTMGWTFAANALTGGLASPLAFTLPAAPAAAALVLRRGKDTRLVLGLAAILFVALALEPAAWAGPPPERPYAAVVALVSVAVVVLLLRRVVADVLDANRRASDEIDRLREESLAHLWERARSLRSIGAKVAHELKNPLAAIKGLVQLVERGVDGARERERIGIISAEIARMEGILREYLSYARPLEDLRPEGVALGPLVRDVAATLAGRAEGAGVRLSTRGDASVSADRRRLKEALINLVQNAIESCDRGGAVEVDVRARAGGAEIVIGDTGRGMTRDALLRVGTPFFTTRAEGTGLGVVLARGVVVHHGGELSYESAPGRGTRARVRLPARATPA